jgi:hypothetical protein
MVIKSFSYLVIIMIGCLSNFLYCMEKYDLAVLAMNNRRRCIELGINYQSKCTQFGMFFVEQLEQAFEQFRTGQQFEEEEKLKSCLLSFEQGIQVHERYDQIERTKKYFTESSTESSNNQKRYISEQIWENFIEDLEKADMQEIDVFHAAELYDKLAEQRKKAHEKRCFNAF